MNLPPLTRESILDAAVRGAAEEVEAIFLEEGTNQRVDRRLYALSGRLRAALREAADVAPEAP